MSQLDPVRLALFTRFPVGGKAKTRLIPAVGVEGAAHIHRQLTERTVNTLLQSRGKLEIHYVGADQSDFEQWLGEEHHYVEQPEGDLTAKLTAAIEPAPVIFFGSDTPDLTVQHVDAAINALEHNDVTIGPAEDGGYYLIGVRRPVPSLFKNISWSTERVVDETLARAQQKKLTVKLLDVLNDCDRPEDLLRWPWLNA